MSDNELVSDDVDEKVGVYERDEDWVAMDNEVNEGDYVLASDDEEMNEASKSDIRFVEQDNYLLIKILYSALREKSHFRIYSRLP